ncbi:MAG: hypothetical protein WKF73_13145 [Nocardioidaceae bacterium]
MCWPSRTWPGLLRAPAARTLVSALRERFDLPVHLHTHDTPGGQLATLLAAIDAGVDAVDAASAALSGTTSQPALSALVAGTDATDRATGLSTSTLCATWSRTGRRLAGCMPRSSRGCRLRPAASTPTRFPADSCPTSASRRSPSDSARSSSRSRTCTPPPTTSSATSSRSLRPARSSVTSPCTWWRSAPIPQSSPTTRPPSTYPDSVIGFLSGELGDPPGGWPEPFRTKALAGRTVRAARDRT